MPALLDLQRQLHEGLISDAPVPVGSWVQGTADAAERLEVYRATVQETLVRALRLAFPAVHRLVGAEFFEGAARIFAQAHLPAAADLNRYGSDFPSFLEQFPPCMPLAYLPDVARLDWAVATALHARDAEPLAFTALAAAVGGDASLLRFTAHPSITFLSSGFPVDAIWRAVLGQDEGAMGAIELHSGPVHLIVERLGTNVNVERFSEPEWHFSRALLDGCTLGSLLDEPTTQVDAPALLAAHFGAGRVIGLSHTTKEGVPS